MLETVDTVGTVETETVLYEPGGSGGGGVLLHEKLSDGHRLRAVDAGVGGGSATERVFDGSRVFRRQRRMNSLHAKVLLRILSSKMSMCQTAHCIHRLVLV